MRPGITDPASLAYVDEAAVLARFDDCERAYVEVVLPAKLALSLDYLERRTVWSDLGIVARTATHVARAAVRAAWPACSTCPHAERARAPGEYAMTGEARPLAAGVRTGVRWVAGAHYTGMVARLGVSLALARLLAPADFGVMALAMAVVGVLALLQESGLGAAVVQYRGRLDQAAGAAFTLATTGGALAALAIVMAAPVLATVLHQPRVEPVLRVLAATCVVRGAAQTSRALLQRAMAFRTLALIELSGTLVYGAVGLGLAFRGAGIWSLVAGQIACEMLLATAVMLSCTPRPVPWRATRTAARELLAFGRPMMLANLCTLIRGQLPTFVAGRVLGATPLGLYTMAQRWASLPVTGITHVAGRVAYPALARLSDDRERLAAAWLRILGGVTTLATPAATCLAVVADPLVRTLYDERWHPPSPRSMSSPSTVASMPPARPPAR